MVVALNAGHQYRGSYKLWKQPGPPDLVLEALPGRTCRRDLRIKPRLFEDLGVREYWIIDPIGKLAAPIMGHRLRDERYEPLRARRLGKRRTRCGALDRQGEFRLRSLEADQPVPDFKGLTRLHAEAERRIAELGSEPARPPGMKALKPGADLPSR